ncbi:MAG: hypothetical protein HQ574_08420 [Chloroflexi bacterium]|nr:hypothetical protein [Chloroflexota bacterium]
MAEKEDGSQGFLSVLFISLEGDDITLEIIYHRKYKIVKKTLDPNEKIKVKKITRPFDINAFIEYFWVEDADSGKLQYTFNPALNLKFTYTAKAWSKALKDKEASILERPRLAYLVWKGDAWATQWIEFTAEITDVIQPGTDDDPNGYICLTIAVLEDPLIGGC